MTNELVRRLKCERCRKRVKHLVLTLEGHGIPFHRHQHTPEWILDRRSGAWRERRGTFWDDVDYASAAARNEPL